jgi:flagellin-like hook-associated protein FlgL
MVMSPRTSDTTKKSAGIVTEFQEGKRALSSAGIRKNAQASHEAAEAGLDRLRQTLAAEQGIHPGLERMREKLSRAVCAVRIQHENRLAAASNMSDVDVVLSMSEFVRRQLLPQVPLSGLRQTDGLALLLVK